MEAAEASTDVRVGAESREEESVCTEKERDIEGRVLQDRLRLVQEVCVVCVCVCARARADGRTGGQAGGRAGGRRAGGQARRRAHTGGLVPQRQERPGVARRRAVPRWAGRRWQAVVAVAG